MPQHGARQGDHVYHWKHGWIPLNAAAAHVVEKRMGTASAHQISSEANLASLKAAAEKLGPGSKATAEYHAALKAHADKMGPHSRAAAEHKAAVADHAAHTGSTPKVAEHHASHSPAHAEKPSQKAAPPASAHKVAAQAHGGLHAVPKTEPKSSNKAFQAGMSAKKAAESGQKPHAQTSSSKFAVQEIAHEDLPKYKPPTKREVDAAAPKPPSGNHAFLANMSAKRAAESGQKPHEATPAKPPMSSAEKLAAQAQAHNQPKAPKTAAEKLAAPHAPVRGPVEPMSDIAKEDSLSGLDDAHVEALRTYTGDAYAPINKALRKGKRPAEHDDTVAELDAALAAKPLKAPIKVWRTVGTDSFGLGWNEDPSGIVGKAFTEKGFMSTASVDQKFDGNAKVHLTFEVPPGVGAVSVEPISEFPEEKEIVLQRNLNYVVTSVRHDPNGGWLATARIMPPSVGKKKKAA
jgi:hypothetical protein